MAQNPKKIQGPLFDIPEEKFVNVGLFFQKRAVFGSRKKSQMKLRVLFFEAVRCGCGLKNITESAEANPKDFVPGLGPNYAHFTLPFLRKPQISSTVCLVKSEPFDRAPIFVLGLFAGAVSTTEAVSAP